LIRLSVCIATFNRAAVLGETLESMLPQLGPGIEVVVVDGASADGTREIMEAYSSRNPAIRYFREAENSGVDKDYDKAVGYAEGEFCWLATDDDLLAPHALARVMSLLDVEESDVLIVDAQIRDRTLTETLRAQRLGFSGMRRYGPDDGDALLADAGNALSFIGGTIVRRQTWMSRDREPYFGSLFIHIGVIFQAPLPRGATVLAEPLVLIRAGNAMWRARSFEIWSFKWPSLIWGFDRYRPDAKDAVTPKEPWRRFRWLMVCRAMGAYSIDEYRRFLLRRRLGPYRMFALAAALFPGRVANLLFGLVIFFRGRAGGDDAYDLVECSRYSNRLTRLIVAARGNRQKTLAV
jgi:glycosyltransferase involved in cell wall biosynthesis